MKDLRDMTRGELAAEASAFAASHAGDAWEMLPARRGRPVRGRFAKVGLYDCDDAQLRAFLTRARRAEFVWLRAALRLAVAEASGDLEMLRYALAVLRRDPHAARPRRTHKRRRMAKVSGRLRLQDRWCGRGPQGPVSNYMCGRG